MGELGGGVLIDDRPLGDKGYYDRGCIPALDDPPLTDAAGGDWYSDGYVVFRLVVNGEAAAFPKNMMEIHELVTITMGGQGWAFHIAHCADRSGLFP